MRREVLADAGFYYNKRDRMSICYHCGVGIENWSPGEDPRNRYAISSPSCCYLLTVRGCEYVDNVTDQDLYEYSAEVSRKKRNLHHEPYV
jgi:hypothetical protein